jgi:hypothetical protein
MLFELHPPDSFTQLWSVQTNGNIRELPPLALASLVPTVLLITLTTSELSRQLAKRWRNSTRTSMSTSWRELQRTTWTISLESRQNVSMTDWLLPYSLAVSSSVTRFHIVFFLQSTLETIVRCLMGYSNTARYLPGGRWVRRSLSCFSMAIH